MTAKLDPIMNALARRDALDPAAAAVTAIGRGIPRDLARRAQEFLGHPSHPVFTDLPIGFWTSAWFLDLLPGRAATATAARRLLALGVLSTVPAVVSGLGDASDLKRRDRRLSAAHGGLNVVATVAFAMSWWMRRTETTGRARVVCHVGATLATAAAAIGGRLAFPAFDPQSGDSLADETVEV
jgi:hypothetical protein